MLLTLTIEVTASADQFLDHPAGKFTVFIGFVVLQHVEIDRSIHFVRQSLFQNSFNQGNLLGNMTGCTGLNARFPGIQKLHIPVIGIGVLLGNLHRLQLFEFCFLLDFILSLIRITLQVTDIRNIPNVANAIAQVCQVSVHSIKSNRRSAVAQVGISIYRRSADIHSHKGRIQRLEIFLLPRKSIVKLEVVSFHRMYEVRSTKYQVR